MPTCCRADNENVGKISRLWLRPFLKYLGDITLNWSVTITGGGETGITDCSYEFAQRLSNGTTFSTSLHSLLVFQVFHCSIHQIGRISIRSVDIWWQNFHQLPNQPTMSFLHPPSRLVRQQSIAHALAAAASDQRNAAPNKPAYVPNCNTLLPTVSWISSIFEPNAAIS